MHVKTPLPVFVLKVAHGFCLCLLFGIVGDLIGNPNFEHIFAESPLIADLESREMPILYQPIDGRRVHPEALGYIIDG